jgi:hypothetical protein
VPGIAPVPAVPPVPAAFVPPAPAPPPPAVNTTCVSWLIALGKVMVVFPPAVPALPFAAVPDVADAPGWPPTPTTISHG